MIKKVTSPRLSCLVCEYVLERSTLFCWKRRIVNDRSSYKLVYTVDIKALVDGVSYIPAWTEEELMKRLRIPIGFTLSISKHDFNWTSIYLVGKSNKYRSTDLTKVNCLARVFLSYQASTHTASSDYLLRDNLNISSTLGLYIDNINYNNIENDLFSNM